MIRLTLRPEPDGTDERGCDPIIRLRALLKIMLRRFGWRCTRIGSAGIDDGLMGGAGI